MQCRASVRPDLVQAGLHALPLAVELLLLAPDERGEDAEQLQVALGRDVVMARQLGQVLLAFLRHCLVNPHAHGGLGARENVVRGWCTLGIKGPMRAPRMGP